MVIITNYRKMENITMLLPPRKNPSLKIEKQIDDLKEYLTIRRTYENDGSLKELDNKLKELENEKKREKKIQNDMLVNFQLDPIPQQLLHFFYEKTLRSSENGILITDENEKLHFQVLNEDSFAPFLWYVRSETNWPTYKDIFDVLCGKSFDVPIVKGILLFTQHGIWEITTTNYVPVQKLNDMVTFFSKHTEQFIISNKTPLSDSDLKDFKKPFQRFQELKIFFEKWPKTRPYFIRTKLNKKDLSYHQPLTLFEIASKHLLINKAKANVDDIIVDDIIVDEARSPVSNSNLIEDKKEQAVTPLSNLELTKKLHKFIKWEKDKKSKKKEDTIKLESLFQKAAKEYKNKENVIKESEGLSWELFDFLGKSKIRKKDYLLEFKNNPKLQRFLDNLIPDNFVTKDILFGNLYMNDNFETKVWEIIGLEKIQREVRFLIKDKNDIPKILLDEYQQLFEANKITPKFLKSFFDYFWKDKNIQNFSKEFLIQYILHNFKPEKRISLRELGCGKIIGLNEFLDLDLNKNHLSEILYSCNAYSLIQLYNCLQNLDIKEEEKIPKNILIDRLVENHVHIVDRNVLKLYVCTNIHRHLNIDEYNQIKNLLKNCADNYDIIVSKFPDLIQNLSINYSKFKLSQKSLKSLIDLAQTYNIPYKDICGFSKKDLTKIEANLHWKHTLRKAIMAKFNSLEELLAAFVNLKDHFIGFNSLGEALLNLSFNELLEVSKTVVPVEYFLVTEAFKTKTVVPLKIRESDRNKPLNELSFMNQFRLEERRLIATYFNQEDLGSTLKEVPAITVNRVVTEEEIVEKLFNDSYEKNLSKMLNKLAVKETTYEKIFEKVLDFIKTISSVNIDVLIDSITAEEVLHKSKTYTTDFSVELEEKLYFYSTKESQSELNPDKITSYLQLAAKLDYISTIESFQWFQNQANKKKLEYLKDTLKQPFLPIYLIPELVSNFVGSEKLISLFKKDVYKHYLFWKQQFLYGPTAKLKSRPKYLIPKLCKPIISKIPLEFISPKCIGNYVYLIDNRTFSKSMYELSSANKYDILPLFTSLKNITIAYGTETESIYFHQFEGDVFNFNMKTGSIIKYKTNVVNFFKFNNTEVWLDLDGNLVLNDEVLSKNVCLFCAGQFDLVFVIQTKQQQNFYYYNFSDRVVILIEPVENLYSDGLHVYQQRGIETISNNKRIYHKHNQKEFILNNMIGVLDTDNNFYLREVHKSEQDSLSSSIVYKNCYGFFNNCLLCLEDNVSVEKTPLLTIIKSPDKFTFAFRCNDKIILMS